MANIMNLVNLKNNVHRSGFDLSRRNCFTAKVGEIIPVMCEEVLPGDVWKINLREFMRTAPVQTATFGRVRQYYDFYFVPYSLLWDKWESWIMQTKQTFHAQSIIQAADEFPTHPYMSLNQFLSCLDNMKENGMDWYLDYHKGSRVVGEQDAYNGTKRLLSYLGYPTTRTLGMATSDLALNPFPLLAYQKIYQDHFRWSQWEDAAPWTYNLDYILSSGKLRLDLATVQKGANRGEPNLFTLRYCNLDKDYFNGILPAPQYGDTAIAGPLSGSASSVTMWSPDNKVDFQMDVSNWSSANGGYFGALGYFAANETSALDLTNPRVDSSVQGSKRATLKGMSPSGSSPLGLYGVVDATQLGLSILLLRQAEALQKWKEITLSGDLDYRTQLQKHWNVNAPASDSYMCRYLGGSANDIDISEVINTNLVDPTAEAEIHGKGISASNGNITFKANHEYGLIMCVYHCKPILEWNAQNVLPRMLTKTKATDYAIPEFDQIGMQSVLVNEFAYDTSNPEVWKSPAGYAPRYVEYKTSFDVVHGEFQDSLKAWVLNRQLMLELGSSVYFKTFKVQPDCLDNMFGVQASDADQFRCTAYLGVKVVRNLDRNGLPY